MDGAQSVHVDMIRIALRRRMETRISTEGSITFPAVPAMAQEYTERCARVFAEVGRTFNDDERTHLATVIGSQLRDAFERSQRSTITVTYQSRPAGALNYTVTNRCLTIEETYHEWIATRQPPFFGTEPDARVCAVAQYGGEPTAVRVLDIGAGTGRNTLALARRGHPVDAVEVTEKFADTIRAEASQEGLDVRVMRRDVFASGEDLRRDYSMVVASEVVPEFRTAAELRALFELAAGCLVPGGFLVFNVFVSNPGYVPDDSARQFAEQAYSGFVTPAELAAAGDGLPLDLIADDSVLDYEKAHQPPESWPPTSWYEGWASGHDAFDLDRASCPIDLRWLVYRRT